MSIKKKEQHVICVHKLSVNVINICNISSDIKGLFGLTVLCFQLRLISSAGLALASRYGDPAFLTSGKEKKEAEM